MAIYHDIHLAETEDELVFRNDQCQLHIDRAAGVWQELRCRDTIIFRAETLAATLDVQIDDVWLVATHGAALQDYAVEVDPASDRVLLALTYHLGEPEVEGGVAAYTLMQTLALTPGTAGVERAARLVRHAGVPGDEDAAPQRFQAFRFQIPGMEFPDRIHTVIDVPGPFPYWDREGGSRNFIPVKTPLEDVPTGTYPFFSAPDTGFGVLSVTDQTQGFAVTGWMETGGEVAYRPVLTYEQAEDASTASLTFAFVNERATWLVPQGAIASDIQRTTVTGSLVRALSIYRDVAEQTMPPALNPPTWIDEMVLLEAMPAYFASDEVANDGASSFRVLADRLPFYRDVGFTAVHLMPHWQGGYSPIDLFQVEPRFGTAEELRAMIETAHALGMRVLFDLVIHGFNEDSSVLDARPDLCFRDAEGNLARHPTWKSFSTDWASPAYQAYMGDLARYNLETYDVDGYRVDAASFKGANWDPDLPYPAYRSGAAAVEVIRAMLSAMRETKPDAVMLNEVFGPLFYTVCDLAHDNMTMGPQLFLEQAAAGETTAQVYKAHMADVLAMLPTAITSHGVHRVFFARNHDTAWFYHFNGYTPRFMALDAVHALFGIPEVFSGDPKHGPNPDDDPEIFESYRRLFALRCRYPELTRGEVLLREVRSDHPNVFTGARRLAATALTLVAISLNDQPSTVRLYVDPVVPVPQGRPVWFDALTGAPIGTQQDGEIARSWRLELRPFQIAIGRFRVD